MAYYSEKLAGHKLKECYEIASERVKQYLEAEIEHVAGRIEGRCRVLELGCGYGRVVSGLARAAGRMTGIDTSLDSLHLAVRLTRSISNCDYAAMDAVRMGFEANVFDAVICVQNGICAFNVDRHALIMEAVRVARPGGIIIFSSYSDTFWPHRLDWFERQSMAGLLGEIDWEASKEGTIVCRDGFRAGRLGEEGFRELCGGAGLGCTVSEVDGSSVFCEIKKVR